MAGHLDSQIGIVPEHVPDGIQRAGGPGLEGASIKRKIDLEGPKDHPVAHETLGAWRCHGVANRRCDVDCVRR